jgi:hypothetical protein
VQVAKETRETQAEHRRNLRLLQESVKAVQKRRREEEIERICFSTVASAAIQDGQQPASDAEGAGTFELPEELQEYRGDPDDR